MMMLDPQPLPISPIRSPPAPRCPSPAGDGSLVQRPEKSGLVCAVALTARSATSALLKRFVRRFINFVSFGSMAVNYRNSPSVRAIGILVQYPFGAKIAGFTLVTAPLIQFKPPYIHPRHRCSRTYPVQKPILTAFRSVRS